LFQCSWCRPAAMMPEQSQAEQPQDPAGQEVTPTEVPMTAQAAPVGTGGAPEPSAPPPTGSFNDGAPPPGHAGGPPPAGQPYPPPPPAGQPAAGGGGGSDELNSMGASVQDWANSFRKFADLSLKPLNPLPLNVLLNLQPADAYPHLQAWLIMNIWIRTVVYILYPIFLSVGLNLCYGTAGGIYIGLFFWYTAIYGFAWSWLGAWAAWYCLIEAQCEDQRCPCCLGRVCYLLCAVYFALVALAGTSGFGVVGCSWAGIVVLMLWLVQMLPCFYIALMCFQIYNAGDVRTVTPVEEPTREAPLVANEAPGPAESA